MAIKSIYKFEEKDLTNSGRAVGAIINNRYRIPVLKALLELGTSSFHTNEELHNYLQDKLNLSDADLVQTGSAIEWQYRIKWSLNHLKNAGLVEKDPNKYLSWKLTKEGRDFLSEYGLIGSHEIEDVKIEEARRKVDTLVKQNDKKKSIRYWAGGFGRGAQFYERLNDFMTNNYWQALDYDEDSNPQAADKALALFEEISIGDKFLIKGYGGTHDLNVYYIGEVVNKIEDEEKLIFKSLNVPQFKTKAPKGRGAGNWRDTLIEIIRPEDINLLFNNGYKQNEGNDSLDHPINLKNLNIILYGPPGTGKTYSLQNNYFKYFTSKTSSLTKEQYFINNIVNYSWWQVIGAALLDLNKASVTQILNHDLVSYKSKASDSNSVRATLWSQLQAHTIKECKLVNVERRMDPLIFNKLEDSVWELSTDVKEMSPVVSDLLNEYKNFKPTSEKEIKRYKFLTFHQSYSYEDFIEGIKPVLSNDGTQGELNYIIETGVFKEMCETAALDQENPYAIFIDEINRGNVSSIFGELISLIEEDKRIGAENELKAQLPYSKRAFGVPNNLYIIGTLNTADRSVEALDTALRRRFSFIEMMPDYSAINSNLEVDVVSLLFTINKRLKYLLNEDHQIGHSYFMNLQSIEDLKNVFKLNIVPLLKEYFYNDTSKIMLVLGEGFVTKSNTKPKFAVTSVDTLDKEIYNLVEINDQFNFLEAIVHLKIEQYEQD